MAFRTAVFRIKGRQAKGHASTLWVRILSDFSMEMSESFAVKMLGISVLLI
jgi:hypothetical protein